MQNHNLSSRSKANLVGVHPDLVRVVELALKKSEVDFMVVEGVRSRETMLAYYGKGRTAQECLAKGVPARYAQPTAKKVTWLNNPLMSNHRIMADGYGHAVDLLPAPYDWKNPKDFDKMAKAMFEAAEELGVSIRWGADWDADGKPRERGETDSPHFELAA